MQNPAPAFSPALAVAAVSRIQASRAIERTMARSSRKGPSRIGKILRHRIICKWLTLLVYPKYNRVLCSTRSKLLVRSFRKSIDWLSLLIFCGVFLYASLDKRTMAVGACWVVKILRKSRCHSSWRTKIKLHKDWTNRWATREIHYPSTIVFQKVHSRPSSLLNPLIKVGLRSIIEIALMACQEDIRYFKIMHPNCKAPIQEA